MHAKLLGVALTALTVVALAAAPAEAQGTDRGGGHDEGYGDGARAGSEDARGGGPFEYQRHRDYRAADNGYQRREGRPDDYKAHSRAGFVAGYRDGYYSSGGGRRRALPPFASRQGYVSRPGRETGPGDGGAPVVDIA
ncbi:MAG TPA: hypothetical protein VMW48_01130, partial [Vicinamibacterales bacterium]|nr:hypothetical protein [Vicinamibacterales bacterium]